MLDRPPGEMMFGVVHKGMSVVNEANSQAPRLEPKSSRLLQCTKKEDRAECMNCLLYQLERVCKPNSMPNLLFRTVQTRNERRVDILNALQRTTPRI